MPPRLPAASHLLQAKSAIEIPHHSLTQRRRTHNTSITPVSPHQPSCREAGVYHARPSVLRATHTTAAASDRGRAGEGEGEHAHLLKSERCGTRGDDLTTNKDGRRVSMVLLFTLPAAPSLSQPRGSSTATVSDVRRRTRGISNSRSSCIVSIFPVCLCLSASASLRTDPWSAHYPAPRRAWVAASPGTGSLRRPPPLRVGSHSPASSDAPVSGVLQPGATKSRASRVSVRGRRRLATDCSPECAPGPQTESSPPLVRRKGSRHPLDPLSGDVAGGDEGVVTSNEWLV
jgi:hypothetical protein